MSITEAARALVKMRQKDKMSIATLAGLSEGHVHQLRSKVLQVQLARYFTDALSNTLIREDVVRNS